MPKTLELTAAQWEILCNAMMEYATIDAEDGIDYPELDEIHELMELADFQGSVTISG